MYTHQSSSAKRAGAVNEKMFSWGGFGGVARRREKREKKLGAGKNYLLGGEEWTSVVHYCAINRKHFRPLSPA
jgi:hypothetical protein